VTAVGAAPGSGFGLGSAGKLKLWSAAVIWSCTESVLGLARALCQLGGGRLLRCRLLLVFGTPATAIGVVIKEGQGHQARVDKPACCAAPAR
jgi:hypothetical protein